MNEEIKTPNPGSEEAIKAGCKCPIIDNNNGRGWYEDDKTFIYNMNCELHCSKDGSPDTNDPSQFPADGNDL